jgi:hypothetical protein
VIPTDQYTATARELQRARSLLPGRELAATYAAEDLARTAVEAGDVVFARRMLALHKNVVRTARAEIRSLERRLDELTESRAQVA